MLQLVPRLILTTVKDTGVTLKLACALLLDPVLTTLSTSTTFSRADLFHLLIWWIEPHVWANYESSSGYNVIKN